ncbi:MAG: ATP-binding protein [Geobacteraceae bacterium]|nr:ATP-binding protein [Geobacteraceae bacterium]
MGFIRAQRKRAKARIGLVGPAGSGKSMSALKLAFGIVGPEGRIAVIDTEHGSASLYAHLCAYDVLELSAPFTAKKYLDAIKEAEERGYDILIIDSLSHAWAGPGGILEFVDNLVGVKNKFTAWREATPQHNSLVEAMLQSPMHIIGTMRAKTEYVITEDDKGKKVPKKVGLAPVQRESMDYEFTLVFDIDRDKHIAIASKDRTSIFDGFCERLEISHGEAIRDWLDTGIEAPAPAAEQPRQAPDPASSPVPGHEEGKGNPLDVDLHPPVITLEQVQQLLKLIAVTQTNEVKFLQYLQVETLAHLPADRFTWAVKALEAKKNTANNPNLVIAALSARNIPYKVDEQAGEIHATPSFQDSGAKAFLKEQGFKWNPAGKAWIKQAA